MSMRLMEGCLNTANSMTETQNVDASTTTLFAQVEEQMVNNCINGGSLKYDISRINAYARNMTPNEATGDRAYDQGRIQYYQQRIQAQMAVNQNVEQQWDADTQTAQTGATTISTDIQQAVQISQAAITASGYISNLLNSPL